MSDLIDQSPASQFDRLPPADLEAEKALLGAITVAGGVEYFPQIRTMVSSASFYSADHQTIFNCLCRLADAGKPIDVVSVRAALIATGVWEEIGGAAYLGEIFNSTPCAAHGLHYAEIVREKANLRAIIQIANEAIRKAFTPSRAAEPSIQIAMKLSDELLQVALHGKSSEAVRLEEAVHEIIASFDDPSPRMIPTGLAELDRIIGGVFFGKNMIISGQAGMGKSQLAKQIVHNAAKAGVACGIVSVEEDRRKIAENYLSAASGVDNHRIAYRRKTADDYSRIIDAIPRLAPLPIWIEDAAFSLTEIIAAVQTLVSKHACRLIVVDHIHLIDGESDGTREREVSKISGALKKLFRRLDISGIAVAQLNRSHQPGERPTLRSLRDSGSLEQDGDQILLLYREDYFNYRTPGYVPTHELEIQVGKNKCGPMGNAVVRFEARTQTVTDMPADPFDGVPGAFGGGEQ